MLDVMNEAQAEELGGILRAVLMLLEGRRSDVGVSIRNELLLPIGFCDGKSVKHSEACILPATPAISGEFLRVDDRFIFDVAARRMFRLFLRSVFEPPVMGGGKFEIAEREDGIIFMPKKHWNDNCLTHNASENEIS